MALAVVLAAAATVSAGSGAVSDPSGDLYDVPTTGGSGQVDIVRATFGHSGGRLVHTVTTSGDIPDPAAGATSPMLFIEHPTTANGTAECTYFVGRHAGKLGVFTCGYGDRVGSARIRRTSARTVRFEFSPRAIGNPASYEWAFLTRVRTRYNASTWVDRLPDGDHGYLTHQLR
ncbi:MAG TPA: hypothetical protein VF715_10735 [Thermoleophilaceae bacterium]